MFKGMALFAKYPYAAGVIACVWLGTAILTAIDPHLPIVRMAIINVVATTILAAIGFRGSR